MAYSRFDSLVDRHSDILQDIETIEAYPAIEDPSGDKLAALNKELIDIEKELDSLGMSEG